MVWEVKFTPCWLPRGEGVGGPYWLIQARNALDPSENLRGKWRRLVKRLTAWRGW